jgi:peptidoglycan hydrolase-like protein with peptidoglycan-binding domain
MFPTKLLAAACAIALGLSACASGSHGKNAARVSNRHGTTSTAPTTSSTTGKPTTTTAKPLPGIGMGASGDAVKSLQQRLTDLKYSPGAVDGHFGLGTYFAVVAFQKVEGMARTGRATDDVVAKLATAGEPAAMLPSGGGTRVEVDLKRQVLFLYLNGSLARIEPVSTGSGQRYCVKGDCAVAVTPGGSFRIGTKILGDHVSPLGHLYNPLFFNGGIAIHGEPAVPNYPASHGCVRIPMHDSMWFYNTVQRGTAVYVLGGKAAPVPFNEPDPGNTTTTTAKPSTTTSHPSTTTTNLTTSTTA